MATVTQFVSTMIYDDATNVDFIVVPVNIMVVIIMLAVVVLKPT